MTHVRAFIAGFLSVLIFHQVVIQIFHLMGALPHGAWSMAATPPFGVPQVISAAFWGGAWGVVIAWWIRNSSGTAWWVRATVLGSLAPTAVALFVVFPLKGLGFAAGWDPKFIVGALIVNAAWGFGLALLMRTLKRVGI